MNSRRGFLAGAAGAVAAGSAVPVAADAAPSAGIEDRAATIHDLAALQFNDEGPELEQVLGTLADWVEEAVSHYPIVRLAVAALRKDDVATHSIVDQAGVEAMTQFCTSISQVGGYYRAIGEVLQTAEIRTMAGLARHALAEEPAA